MNLNKVFISGRLTADPQLRQTPTGQQVATFSVATNRVWNDKAGARQEEVEYHNVVVWGRQAEVAAQFLTKGALVLVEGRLKTRSWKDQQDQTRKVTEIICERMQFGPRSSGGGGSYSPRSQSLPTDAPAKEELPEINIDEENIKAEDLPF